MRATRRQGLPDLPDVGLGQFGNEGGAKGEAPRMARGQGEDRQKALSRRLRGHGPARGRSVFGKRRLDVHGEMRVRMADQDCGQDVRPHAVGINPDARPESGQFGREIGQSGGERGFAAGEDDAVELV